MSFNQSVYLNRIQISSPPPPTFDALCQLQKAHLFAIPFENLDMHYDRPIYLDLDKIYQKVVLDNRGGFCYELNGLFYQLLISLGYQVKMVSGRVYNKKRVLGQEFDHLALIVSIDQKEYLCEVGFGAFAIHPLEIKFDIWQQDPSGNYMIQQGSGEYLSVGVQEKDEVVASYIFGLKERTFEEFEGMCHYQQTSPDSNFTNRWVITIPTKEGRITLTNTKLKIEKNGNVEESDIDSKEMFCTALEKYFGMSFEY